MPYAVQLILADEHSTVRTGPSSDRASALADLEKIRYAMESAGNVTGVEWYAGQGMSIRSAMLIETQS